MTVIGASSAKVNTEPEEVEILVTGIIVEDEKLEVFGANGSLVVEGDAIRIRSLEMLSTAPRGAWEKRRLVLPAFEVSWSRRVSKPWRLFSS